MSFVESLRAASSSLDAILVTAEVKAEEDASAFVTTPGAYLGPLIEVYAKVLSDFQCADFDALERVAFPKRLDVDDEDDVERLWQGEARWDAFLARIEAQTGIHSVSSSDVLQIGDRFRFDLPLFDVESDTETVFGRVLKSLSSSGAERIHFVLLRHFA